MTIIETARAMVRAISGAGTHAERLAALTRLVTRHESHRRVEAVAKEAARRAELRRVAELKLKTEQLRRELAQRKLQEIEAAAVVSEDRRITVDLEVKNFFTRHQHLKTEAQRGAAQLLEESYRDALVRNDKDKLARMEAIAAAMPRPFGAGTIRERKRNA